MNLHQAISYACEHPGRNVQTRCPCHSDNRASLSVRMENNRLQLHCFAGCSSADIHALLQVHGLDIASADTRARFEPEPTFDQRRMNAIMRTWTEGARPIVDGDLASLYFKHRYIDLPEYNSETIRFSNRVRCWTHEEGFFYLPAILCAVRDIDGNIVSLHRTYLDPNGNGKAPIPDPKRLMSPPTPGLLRGAAIRLFEAKETLGVAEGVETALACHIATGGLPVWATVTANGMEALKVPEAVKRVVIFGDNDRSGCGQRVAEALKNRLVQEGKRVEKRIPAGEGRDFADELFDRRHYEHRTNTNKSRAI